MHRFGGPLIRRTLFDGRITPKQLDCMVRALGKNCQYIPL